MAKSSWRVMVLTAAACGLPAMGLAPRLPAARASLLQEAAAEAVAPPSP